MKNFLPTLILSAALVLGLSVSYFRIQSVRPKPTSPAAEDVAGKEFKNCVPTFVDGGGPYYLPNAPFRDSLAPNNSAGEKLTVSGRVLASDCISPLTNVVLDLWQANESGNYEDEWYRGQITTNSNGEYSFTTVIPLGYGAGTGYRPPHIHFKIWQNSQELITSQMFLPVSRAQGIEDAYIMQLQTSQTDQGVTHTGRHDIILPGI